MVYLPDFEETVARYLFSVQPHSRALTWERVHPGVRDKYIVMANNLIIIFCTSGWTPPKRVDKDQQV